MLPRGLLRHSTSFNSSFLEGIMSLKEIRRTRATTPINTILMFVPQQEAWIVERMGKFHRILDPGLNVLLPVMDSVKYVQSLKEMAIDIPKQSAITAVRGRITPLPSNSPSPAPGPSALPLVPESSVPPQVLYAPVIDDYIDNQPGSSQPRRIPKEDSNSVTTVFQGREAVDLQTLTDAELLMLATGNISDLEETDDSGDELGSDGEEEVVFEWTDEDNVTLNIDGVLYLRVLDPYLASYGVEDPEFAITQLAQTTMRSELGKISLDNVFRERENLNVGIVASINKASEAWGITCLRYEIRDIKLPPRVQDAMQMQVEAERKKRATILESEGVREADINKAEGQRASKILESEAHRQQQINNAQGEAEALLTIADARAKGLNIIAKALSRQDGKDAATLHVAEQYIQTFGKLAKKNNTMILSNDVNNIPSLVSQAMAIYKTVSQKSEISPQIEGFSQMEGKVSSQDSEMYSSDEESYETKK